MNESVTVDFSATGNLGATLTQMIQQSTEAAKVTDGLVGQFGRLNSVTMALISRTTALTGANKTAVAQAAAYQEAMAGIASTAAVTGQSFQRLEKITLQLGRSIPGGIGDAVRIVQTLQSSGVTAERQIESLGKAFARLGEANGVDGAALGRDLLSLNRIFGNSESSVAKFGDSLTTVSKTFGASAEGTVAFAKALAPVASSVGMSQTAVLGLSAAAARLGEDGSAGATAFNKVLLDMQQSVRDGTPGLKEYANVLNMSSESLKALFKQDPSEVLMRFTEAIRRNSPDTQRSLEALGFDSTRTIRSLQAISSTGNLRQMVNSASMSFGGGSTEKGAEEAVKGVSAQAKILGETLSQTVASAGRPFLDWLSKVMQAANAASGAIAGVMESEPVQKAGKVAALVMGSGSTAMGALNDTALLAMGVLGYKGLKNFGGNFRAGAAETTATGVRATPGIAARAGEMAAKAGYAPRYGPRQMGFRQYVGAAWRGTLNTTASYVNMQTSTINRALGKPGAVSPGGSAARGILSAGRASAKIDWGAGNYRAAVGELTKSTGAAAKAFLNAESAGANMAKAFGRATIAIGEFSAKAVGSTVKAMGRGFSNVGLGGWGPMLAMAGGFYAYEKLQGYQDQQKEFSDQQQNGFSDAYRAFNDFAAAAGVAGKGLLSFSDAVSTTTKQLAAQNTTLSQAYDVTSSEAANAQSGGYQRAFSVAGDNMRVAALQARLTLGENASPEAIARMGMDLTNQFGQTAAQDILNQVKNLSMPDAVQQSLDVLSGTHDPIGGSTETSAGVVELVNSAITQRQDAAASVYGPEAGQVSSLQSAQELWSKALSLRGQGPQSEGARRDIAASISKITGISQDVLEQAFRDNVPMDTFMSAMDWTRTANQNAWDLYQAGVHRQNRVVAGQDAVDWGEVAAGNYRTINLPSDSSQYAYLDTYKKYKGKTFQDVATSPVADVNAQKMQDTLDRIAGKVDESGGDLVDALFGASRKVRQYGTAKAAAPYLTADQETIDRYANDPTSKNQAAAAEVITRNALGRMRNSSMASLQIILDTAGAGYGENNPMRGAAARSLADIARISSVEAPTQSFADRNKEMRQTGIAAIKVGQLEDTQLEQQRIGIADKFYQQFSDELSFMKQFLQANRQAQIQISRMDEGFNIQRTRMTRDYHIQAAQAEEDYHISRHRARHEYHLGVHQAEHDFHLQRSRARRDFEIGEEHAERDFNTQKMRMTRDFNKSINRMIQDQAQSVYDPYKRIQAQQVWDAKSLLKNLQEQNVALVKQTQNLAKAKQLGLSQNVIDQLRLTDSGNAQQLDRLVVDLVNDPTLVKQYNDIGKQRIDATENLVKQGINYRRSVDDFNTSLSDSTKDFKTSMRDSKQAFKLQMSDSLDDFETTMERSKKKYHTAMKQGANDYHRAMDRTKNAFHLTLGDMEDDLGTTRTHIYEDLARLGEDVSSGTQDTVKKFTAAVAAMPNGVKTEFSANLISVMENASSDLETFIDNRLKPYGLTSEVFKGPTVAVQIASQAQWNRYVQYENDQSSYGKTGRSGRAETPTDLAQEVVRHVSSGDVRAARTAQYGTPVVNNTYNYDQRTHFSGSIQVEAKDPDHLVGELRRKIAHSRLVSPGRAALSTSV